MASGRMRELLRKYGKVGFGVHLSVSVASTAGLYVAIKNNVDVQSIFHKIGLEGILKDEPPQPTQVGMTTDDGSDMGDQLISQVQVQAVEDNKKRRNRTAELAASSGGALALALLCNKALFPVRVPITLVLTPPLARFLARRRIITTTTSSSSAL